MRNVKTCKAPHWESFDAYTGARDSSSVLQRHCNCITGSFTKVVVQGHTCPGTDPEWQNRADSARCGHCILLSMAGVTRTILGFSQAEIALHR